MSAQSRERLETAFEIVLAHLVGEAKPDGSWEGRLSSSALSTATAISALSIAGEPNDRDAVSRGLAWLSRTANNDGGWGDTTDSPSNLATTLLVTAAHKLAGTEIAPQAQAYVTAEAGETEADLVAAIENIYGNDRTFAVPILANCALAGMVSWNHVPALPFELAIFPRSLYRLLRLHVVSYALPALIAIGLAIHHHAPSRSPVRRFLRNTVAKAVLTKLLRILPESGGFLEATPLTSFVAMSLGAVENRSLAPRRRQSENRSLAPCGRRTRTHPSDGNPVLEKCLDFIRRSQRENGSWPIDSNLSVWVTTNAVTALANASRLDEIDRNSVGGWLVARQYKTIHPFTGAAPGGFGWTHLPGGVPDADDTSGAVLACLALGKTDSARAAVKWLLDLQNADGGWPAFCRGWGELAFDRSSPDITAHAIRAIRAFDPDQTNPRCRRAVERGYDYMARAQQPDGSWIPLWFGNQAAGDQSNRTLGTARSLLSYETARACGNRQSQRKWGLMLFRGTTCQCCASPGAKTSSVPFFRGQASDTSDTTELSPVCADCTDKGEKVSRGVKYLLRVQNADGGWGGGPGIKSSVEETALAVTALIQLGGEGEVERARERGVEYLVSRVEDSTWTTPAPIGLYFSSLWYSERLYPVIWTAEALGLAIRAFPADANRSDSYVYSA